MDSRYPSVQSFPALRALAYSPLGFYPYPVQWTLRELRGPLEVVQIVVWTFGNWHSESKMDVQYLAKYAVRISEGA